MSPSDSAGRPGDASSPSRQTARLRNGAIVACDSAAVFGLTPAEGALYAAAVATLLGGSLTALATARHTKRTLRTQRQMALDEHEHQRQMAHDERVFDQRAIVMAEAIKLLQEVLELWQTDALKGMGVADKFIESYPLYPDAGLLTRLSAYAGPEAVDLFSRGYANAREGARSLSLFYEAEDQFRDSEFKWAAEDSLKGTKARADAALSRVNEARDALLEACAVDTTWRDLAER